ncbi:hypothetical protein [Lactiplantibacillus plantarum]|uniref:hypothetical protein n=1 Tax=Lactiplantibacillus plantarum TaxID=1590 RepID=UPI00225E3D93|nr:hypothetical protein [Lactiplantibacillus plantarum]
MCGLVPKTAFEGFNPVCHEPPVTRTTEFAGVTQVLQENDVEAEEKGTDSPLDTLFLTYQCLIQLDALMS